ncbi:hypothetical protein FQA39_LY06130 [Lamprigera yunnana]|nr:hypothetical protein FQA39_LY06130 [Lamprigera yunnana]
MRPHLLSQAKSAKFGRRILQKYGQRATEFRKEKWTGGACDMVKDEMRQKDAGKRFHNIEGETHRANPLTINIEELKSSPPTENSVADRETDSSVADLVPPVGYFDSLAKPFGLYRSCSLRPELRYCSTSAPGAFVRAACLPPSYHVYVTFFNNAIIKTEL